MATLRSGSSIRLDVRDLPGWQVAVLADGWHGQGSYSIVSWEGGSAIRRVVLMK